MQMSISFNVSGEIFVSATDRGGMQIRRDSAEMAHLLAFFAAIRAIHEEEAKARAAVDALFRCNTVLR